MLAVKIKLQDIDQMNAVLDLLRQEKVIGPNALNDGFAYNTARLTIGVSKFPAALIPKLIAMGAVIGPDEHYDLEAE